MTDRDVALERQALLRVARDLNGLVVSLDRLGSTYADRPRDEQALAVALELRDDAYVVEHLPDNPWGDMAEFRDSIYVPPEHARSSRVLDDPAERLVLDPHEVPPLFSVLERLAESFSGGVPWVALTAEERDTVTWVLRQLAPDR